MYDLERFWKLETLCIQSEKDDESSSEYLTTYQRNCIVFKDGRYSAQLPWKRDNSELPDNYNITLKRNREHLTATSTGTCIVTDVWRDHC